MKTMLTPCDAKVLLFVRKKQSVDEGDVAKKIGSDGLYRFRILDRAGYLKHVGVEITLNDGSLSFAPTGKCTLSAAGEKELNDYTCKVRADRIRFLVPVAISAVALARSFWSDIVKIVWRFFK